MKRIYNLSLILTLAITTTWANCPEVTGLMVTPVSDTEVLLSWDAMTDATHYQMKAELEEGAAPFAFWLSLPDNSYTLGNLVAGGVYKFKVRTICGGEKASWSEFQFFTTSGSGSTGGACGVPSLLSATLDANGNASLSWEPIPGALLYKVEVESEENTTFFMQEFLTTEPFADVAGLAPNGLYKFKVKTQCGSNSSDFSSWAFFSMGGVGGGNTGGGDDNGGNNGGACDTPSGLMVLDISTNSALISWDPVAGAQGYEVQVEDDENTPAFNWETILSDNQVTVTGLAAGGHYQVKVKTKCSGGNNSANTDWVFFSTQNFTGNGGAPSFFQLAPQQEEVETMDVSLTPNPAVSGESIQLSVRQTESSKIVWIQLYDLQGHLYRTMEIPASSPGAIQIPTTGLQRGMYQVVVRSGEEIQSRRFSLLD
ncbi:MAG: fibronectin type III domain-containing protein [Lewinellaceae bacterium]|nr:fibronectin type III domain-containing protein [Lewinellaceae bacterium]